MGEPSSRDFSYWEICSGVSERKPLSPVGTMPSRFDILIVGAGFCGAWLAYFLKREHPKLNLAIVERDFFSLGASSRNAGFLSCGNISEWQEDYRELGWEETVLTLRTRIEGIEIIRAELGSRITVENCGSFDFDELTEEKLELIEKLNAFLVSEKIEPFFERREAILGGTAGTFAFNRFDGQLSPTDLLLSLHRSLVNSGVRFFWSATVRSLGNGEAEIMTSDGHSRPISYGYGFICTNAFARNLNRETCVQPARGQIIVTSPCVTSTSRALGFLRSGYDYFRFIGDRVLVGGGRLSFKTQEGTDVMVPTSALKDYLTGLACQLIGHNRFEVEHHWSGIMGLRRGGHASASELKRPVQIDAVTEELAGFGGWGVTLTPAIARHRARTWR